ncbi:MAG TPA: hypothetical protein VGV93_01545, partial [Acidimicrobiales bacterium]|nr:hypothetical protein [Acidimicrobiales bacterium]
PIIVGSEAPGADRSPSRPRRTDRLFALASIADDPAFGAALREGQWHHRLMPRGERLSPWVGILYAALVVGLELGVIAFLNRPDWELIHIERVEASAQDDVMAVTVLHASCGGPRVLVVEETTEFVAVRADHDVRGGCQDIGLTTTIQVQLDTALGERNIHLEGSESGGAICNVDGTEHDRCGGRPPA